VYKAGKKLDPVKEVTPRQELADAASAG
jgi:hypothetical protein